MRGRLFPLVLLGFLAGAAAHAAEGLSGLHAIDRWNGPDGGWDLASFDPVLRRLYVARPGGVTAVDVDHGTLTGQLAPAEGGHIALPIENGKSLLITNGKSDKVSIADALSGTVRVVLATGETPDAALFEPRTRLVFVMEHKGGAITLIDPRRRAVAGRIAVGGLLEFAATDGHGRVFVNVANENRIAVIDARARRVTARYPLPGCEGPTGLAYDPDDHELIAACANGIASLIDARTGKPLASLTIGPRPDAALYDHRRRLAYIPSGGSGTLAVIALKGGERARVIDIVATGKGARTAALDEKTGRLFLPIADYGPMPADGGKPAILPGSFRILVLGR